MHRALLLQSLPAVYQRFQPVRVTDKVLKIFQPSIYFSTVKFGKKQLPKLENKKYTKKHPDPIRPISDMLLRSLGRRHTDLNKPGQSPVFSGTDLSAASSEELVCILLSIPKNAPRKEEQLLKIEQLLTKRLYMVPFRLILQACHGFYVQRYDTSQFLSHAFSVVDDIFDKLAPTSDEITQLMFYVFVHGAAPSLLFYNVENYLDRHLDKFDINDLGVVCVGFFKGNSRLSSQDLLDAIAERLLLDIDKLDTFLLLDFLKMFRHAGYIKVSFYERLAEHLVSRNMLSKFRSVNPLMHIAFMYASLSIRHTRLFQSLFTRIENLLTDGRTVRTKDISKFVWACGSLQFVPDDYDKRYRRLTSVFQANSTDNRNYPESCAEMLMGLAYFEIFPEDLLRSCLSSDVVSRLVGSSADKEKSIQLLLINESVKLERPNYKGSMLSESQVKEIMQHPSAQRNLETDLQKRAGLLSVLTSLQHCLGENRVCCRYPLLHFKTPVIELQFCPSAGFMSFSSVQSTDSDMAVEQKKTFLQSEKAEQPSVFTPIISGATDTQNKRVAILVSSTNQYAMNDPTHALGHLHTMKRQLVKAGYCLIEIGPEEASEMEWSSHMERCQRLSTLLSAALQSDIKLS